MNACSAQQARQARWSTLAFPGGLAKSLHSSAPPFAAVQLREALGSPPPPALLCTPGTCSPPMASAAALGLNLPAHACAPVAASNAVPSWLIGTTSVRGSNEVLLIEQDDENGTLRAAAAFPHPAGEVWSVTAHPLDGTIIGTVHSLAGRTGVALYKTQPLSGRATQLCDLSGAHTSRVRQVQWNPQDSSALLTLEAAGARLWQVREAVVEVSGSMLAADFQEMECAAWDPHSARLCTAEGGSIQAWDLRQRGKQGLLQGAHAMPIRHLDFAEQHADVLCSCGDDGRIRMWDLRMGGKAQPLIDLAAHQHWVWKASFNPTDSLLISGSSDNTCTLWHINLAAATAQAASPAVVPKAAAKQGASGPAAASQQQQQPAAVATTARAGSAAGARQPPPASRSLPPTGLLQCYTDHNDSVYQVAWSAVDPATFISVSFDGRVMLRTLPAGLKRKLQL